MVGLDRAAWIRYLTLLLGSLLFVAVPLRNYSDILAGASDFRTVYSCARCLLKGCNPYDPAAIKEAFAEKNGGMGVESPGGSGAWRPFNANYPPSSMALVIPFSLLPWKFAVSLWCGLIALLFITATICMVELSVQYSAVLVPVLLAIFLATSNTLIVTEQPAGVAIALCAIGTWAMLRDRWVGPGLVCFALSLALKPQIAMLVWVYFLLSNAAYRRKALMVAGLSVVFCLPGLLLAASHPQAAHWVQYLSVNLRGIAAHGNINDPGPSNPDSYMIANLQTIAGVFRDEANFENRFAWSIFGVLFVAWAYITVRARAGVAKDLLGVASIASMSLLPIYHRHYDARLLVLIFPALALLSKRRGLNAAVAVLPAAALIVLSHPDRIVPGVERVDLAAIGQWHFLLYYRSFPLFLVLMTGLLLICYAKVPEDDQISV